MSVEALMSASLRLAEPVEALAALGAELRLRQDGQSPPPQIRALLLETADAVDPRLFDGIDPTQEQAVLGVIEAIFRQALDLLEKPARELSWAHEDPVILQSQGQASRLIVRGIETLAAQRPEMQAAFARRGSFLDAGTGVGRLAIEAALSFPALRIVGIDRFEPALRLARRNLSESQVCERVELRQQGIEELGDEAKFAAAWLPGPFIGLDVARRALPRVLRALEPGGWLIFGLMAPASTPLAQALATLRILRSGGHPWTETEVETRLSAAGFDRIEPFTPAPSILFVLGRRPGRKR
jgi:SAM-dependent methyltransferase